MARAIEVQLAAKILERDQREQGMRECLARIADTDHAIGRRRLTRLCAAWLEVSAECNVLARALWSDEDVPAVDAPAQRALSAKVREMVPADLLRLRTAVEQELLRRGFYTALLPQQEVEP